MNDPMPTRHRTAMSFVLSLSLAACSGDQPAQQVETPTPKLGNDAPAIGASTAHEPQGTGVADEAPSGGERSTRRAKVRSHKMALYQGRAMWHLDKGSHAERRVDARIAFSFAPDGEVSGYLLTSLHPGNEGRLTFRGRNTADVSEVTLPLLELSGQQHGSITLNFKDVSTAAATGHASFTLPELPDMALSMQAAPIDTRPLPEHEAVMPAQLLTFFDAKVRITTEITLTFTPLADGQGTLSGTATVPTASGAQTITLDAHLFPARKLKGIYSAWITVRITDEAGRSRTPVDNDHGGAFGLPSADGASIDLLLMDNNRNRRIFIEGKRSSDIARQASPSTKSK